MKYISLLLVLALTCTVWANDLVRLESVQSLDNSNVQIATNLNMGLLEDEVFDTYLVFEDSRKTPIYITATENSLDAKVLGMLPPTIELKPMNWAETQEVKVSVYLCRINTKEIFAKSTATITVAATENKASKLPASAQLKFVQEFGNDTNARWYTDYKQFDSSWKYEKMGQYNGTTIGKSGCAMSCAGNIIGRTPSSLNRTLKSNGGYTGNLIIWSKVPGLRYKGRASLSDSLFGKYHVIASLGGHFVLLTGGKSGSKYYSKDPGKSSNPTYSKGQIYSVRLYYK